MHSIDLRKARQRISKFDKTLDKPFTYSECGCTSGGRGDIAVVWSDCLARVVPLEEKLLAGERQWLSLVVRDSRTATISGNVQVLAGRASGEGRIGWVGGAATSNLKVLGVVRVNAVDVGIVDDVQSWDVLPCESSRASWA